MQDNGYVEAVIITAGDDLQSIKRFVQNGTHYSAAEVVKVLQSGASLDKNQPKPKGFAALSL